MDGAEFDAWTRRRFGLATGTLAASALAALGLAEPAAGKKKRQRKKRCKRHLQPCQQGGKRRCCNDLRCDVPSGSMAAQKVCCRTLGKPCSTRSDCCTGLCCEGGPGAVCQFLCT